MKTMTLTAFALILTLLTATADTKVGTNVPPILPPVIPAAAPAAPMAPATTTIAPPAAPAPAKTHAAKKKTSTAAKKPATTAHKTTKPAAKAKTVAKKAAPAYSVPLQPGTATVAAKHVNVRGKPTINSEVVTRLNEGDSVTVIEEITRENAKANDPTVWAKINAPTTAHLWVSSQFVDTNKVVTVKKLNIRTGAGENYSVAGTLNKGDVVKDISSKDGWLEIEAGANNNVAYVAAAYLKQEITAPAGATNDWVQPAPAPTEPAPTPTSVSGDTNTIASSTTELTPAPTPAPAPTAPTAAPTKPAGNELVPASKAVFQTAIPTKGADVSNPPVKKDYTPKIIIAPEPRIVQREGIVRRTFSIQAPTSFALASPETGETINYLYTTAKDLNLARYKGLHIIVTGEEGLDERWRSTPVITIQKIQVVE